jgi:DNA-binding HxlR family transcriptional regulator
MGPLLVDSKLILASPVARALALVGDRWTCLILRDVFLGLRRFEELRKRSGAARGTLTSRLKSMVGNGILYKAPYQESPVRYEYRLTDQGLDLYPFVIAVWAWETRWSQESHIPPTLTHSLCGKIMRPVFRCSSCHSAITMREVTFKPGRTSRTAEKIPARFQRRSKSNSVSVAGVDRHFFHVLDIIGDRWTSLVIASLYFGLKRHDDIAEALGIATNILSDRLKLLVSVGVLQRVPYQEKPLRHEYRLTDKGGALYTHALQLHEWASRWLTDKDEQPLILEHIPCGAPLQSEVVCSECDEPLKVTEVTYDHAFEPGD